MVFDVSAATSSRLQPMLIHFSDDYLLIYIRDSLSSTVEPRCEFPLMRCHTSQHNETATSIFPQCTLRCIHAKTFVQIIFLSRFLLPLITKSYFKWLQKRRSVKCDLGQSSLNRNSSISALWLSAQKFPAWTSRSFNLRWLCKHVKEQRFCSNSKQHFLISSCLAAETAPQFHAKQFFQQFSFMLSHLWYPNNRQQHFGSWWVCISLFIRLQQFDCSIFRLFLFKFSIKFAFKILFVSFIRFQQFFLSFALRVKFFMLFHWRWEFDL